MNFSYLTTEISNGDKANYLILTDKGQLITADVNYASYGVEGAVIGYDVRGMAPATVMSKLVELFDDASKNDDVIVRVYNAEVPDVDDVMIGMFLAGRRRPQKVSADRISELTMKLRGAVPVRPDAVRKYDHSFGGYDDQRSIFVEKLETFLVNASLSGSDDEFFVTEAVADLPSTR